jgi:putative flippase GtrA
MNFLQKFTKRDLGFAVLTGLIAGIIAWRIFEVLKTPEFYNLPWIALMVIVPILWILGVLFGYLLGQWLDFFNQFGKFAAIGFTNFAVTAGVLNILLSITNYTSGIGYSVISGISFMAGILSSYVWNKYWTFRSNNNQGGGQEFVKFFAVTIVAFVINVAVASFIVNYIRPLAGMDAHQWANVGVVAGSAVALVFSFVGFKIAVFKK